jgi:hypothetical protein
MIYFAVKDTNYISPPPGAVGIMWYFSETTIYAIKTVVILYFICKIHISGQ